MGEEREVRGSGDTGGRQQVGGKKRDREHETRKALWEPLQSVVHASHVSSLHLMFVCVLQNRRRAEEGAGGAEGKAWGRQLGGGGVGGRSGRCKGLWTRSVCVGGPGRKRDRDKQRQRQKEREQFRKLEDKHFVILFLDCKLDD